MEKGYMVMEPKEKEKKKRKRYIVVFLLIILLMGVTVGYSVLSTSLTISGVSTIKNTPTWDVHFSNIRVVDGSVTAISPPTLNSSKTKITYNVDLVRTGDFYEFIVDVKNDGNVDARMYNKPVLSGVSESQDEYINYTIKYADGSPILPDQVLEVGKVERFRVRIELDPEVNKVIDEIETLNLSIEIPYEQA